MDESKKNQLYGWGFIAIPFVWAVLYKMAIKTAIISFNLKDAWVLVQWVLVLASWGYGGYLIYKNRQLQSIPLVNADA